MTRPVRVLWLSKGLGRGGAEQLLLNLARTIDSAAVSLEAAYVLPPKDALVPDLEQAGVLVHGLGDPTDQTAWLRRLRRLLDSGAYDIVHTHSPLVAAAARLLAPRRTVLAHTEHNVWQRYRRPTRWLNAATINRNAVVWAVSEGVAESIRLPRIGHRRPSVEVLVHGIDASRLTSGPGAKVAALKRLGLAEGPFTVGSVANLTPKKHQDTLISALVELREMVPDARLVLVGDGPSREHLGDLVTSLALDGSVMFTGVRDDVPDLLPAFDVFSLSSMHEGLPIAMLEAMAAGVPPVVTAVGGIPEVVGHERDGLLVPARDVASLAAALRRLATDHQLRSSLARTAMVRAQQFGIGPAADTLTHRYSELTGNYEEVAIR